MPIRRIAALFLVVLMLFGLLANAALAQEARDEPSPEATTELTPVPTATGATPAPTQTDDLNTDVYIVQAGDNLFRIAIRYKTTVSALAQLNGITNPSLIFSGQRLRVPMAGQPAPSTTPTATTNPDEQQVYIVQRGDILSRIAARYNTTLAAILAVNTIPNPNIIYPGQEIVLPSTADTPTVTPTPTEATPVPVTTEPAPESTAESTEVAQTTPEAMPVSHTDIGFGYGLVVYFDGQNPQQVAGQVSQLSMEWVKVRVDWAVIEPTEAVRDFSALDNILQALETTNSNILLMVTNAPQWSRTSVDEVGPPDDLNDFFSFLEALATRYKGRVDAYQIWEEPNLRRNWNCDDIMCETDYLFMLGESFHLLRRVDPDAAVISAGLAPTRFNDRYNAVDDRLYLETLLARGLGTVVDGIGIHPGGEANPPDATCCEQSVGVESHYEDSSFYFLDNIADYRDLIVEYGNASIPLWVTKFGWGTGEDTAAPTNVNQPHYSVSYTSLVEQATYIPRAFEIGQELGYIGPMFIHNLNGCAVSALGGLPELCYTSLIGPDGNPRAVFTAVQAID